MQPPTQWSATDPAQYAHFTGRWSEHLAGPFLTFADVSPGARVLGRYDVSSPAETA